MKNLLQDIRYGLRQLRKSPGFTAVAVITLALGIGANSAVFSLINAIILRTLPVRNPQSLVLLKWIAHRAPEISGSYNSSACPREMSLPEECSFSYPMFQKIQAEQNVFSDVFALVPVGVTMNVNRRTTRLEGVIVSGNFFSTLGAHPALGRLLGPADDSTAAAPAIVVSYRFWQSTLGGDPGVIGMSILADKTPVTVVGVASPGFLDLDQGVLTDFWLPLSSPAIAQRFADRSPKNLWLELVARLKPSVSVTKAASAMSTLFAASVTNGPEAIFKPGDAPRIQLRTAVHGLYTLDKRFSQPLYALLAAVALVLLIACANIAGLMLARSAARRKEVAMRTALGATRGRIIHQLLTESLLLSMAGGVAGILLGYWGAEALVPFLSRNWYAPLQVDVHPDLRVLAFTLLVSILVGLVFGLAPAFSSGRVDLVPALREPIGSAGASQGSLATLGNALVVVQIALTVIVLAGAGLLVRTLTNLKTVNPGFDPQNLLLFRVDATYSNRTGGNRAVLHQELKEQLASLPGATSVSYSAVSLLAGGSAQTEVFPENQPTSPIEVAYLPIAPNFFRTMRIPVLAGDTLNAQDSENKRADKEQGRRLVINETLARHLFGEQNPIGQRIRVGDLTSPLSEVVGVVGDGKYDDLRNAIVPTIYEAIANEQASFEIRTTNNPKALMLDVRAALNHFDSNLLITDMKTQTEQIDQNIYQERLNADLSSLFALLAMVVACIGIYGVLAYQVTRRTHEIGIRLALGAQRGDVLRLVLRQGTILAMLGTVIGIGAALGVTRYLQSFLFGVKPSDPLTMTGVAILLITVALIASYIPARRAMKTDPMVALRYE